LGRQKAKDLETEQILVTINEGISSNFFGANWLRQ